MLSIVKRISVPSESADMPELDVTPVMNMFIILIPFLVSMAVFTHLAVLKFNLPPNVGTGLDSSQGKPKLKMTIVVAPDYLAITHGDKMLDSLQRINEDYDYRGLQEKLSERRKEAEIQDEAIVAVRDAVKFKHVVAVMDKCREAGFEKIGLSNATEAPGDGV